MIERTRSPMAGDIIGFHNVLDERREPAAKQWGQERKKAGERFASLTLDVIAQLARKHRNKRTRLSTVIPDLQRPKLHHIRRTHHK